MARQTMPAKLSTAMTMTTAPTIQTMLRMFVLLCRACSGAHDAPGRRAVTGPPPFYKVQAGAAARPISPPAPP